MSRIIVVTASIFAFSLAGAACQNGNEQVSSQSPSATGSSCTIDGGNGSTIKVTEEPTTHNGKTYVCKNGTLQQVGSSSSTADASVDGDDDTSNGPASGAGGNTSASSVVSTGTETETGTGTETDTCSSTDIEEGLGVEGQGEVIANGDVDDSDRLGKKKTKGGGGSAQSQSGQQHCVMDTVMEPGACHASPASTGSEAIYIDGKAYDCINGKLVEISARPS